MTYLARKDLGGLVVQGRLLARTDYERAFSRSGVPASRCYWHVFLWRTRAAMLKAIPPLDDGRDRSATQATLVPSLVRFDVDAKGKETVKPLPKLGEFHFVLADWNLEVVAHEVQHAVFHAMRAMDAPRFVEVYQQDPMTHEELACYQAGRWVSAIVAFLSTHEDAEVDRLAKTASRHGVTFAIKSDERPLSPARLLDWPPERRGAKKNAAPPRRRNR